MYLWFILKLIMETLLALNAQESACLFLQRAEIKDICPHAQLH